MGHVKCPGWDGEKGVGLGVYLCETEGEERLSSQKGRQEKRLIIWADSSLEERL